MRGDSGIRAEIAERNLTELCHRIDFGLFKDTFVGIHSVEHRRFGNGRVFSHAKERMLSDDTLKRALFGDGSVQRNGFDILGFTGLRRFDDSIDIGFGRKPGNGVVAERFGEHPRVENVAIGIGIRPSIVIFANNRDIAVEIGRKCVGRGKPDPTSSITLSSRDGRGFGEHDYLKKRKKFDPADELWVVVALRSFSRNVSPKKKS